MKCGNFLLKSLISCCVFIFFSSVSIAATKSSNKLEVEHAYTSWCSAIENAKGNAKAIIKYYAPGAILFPTLSSDMITNSKKGGMNTYFSALTNHPQIKCNTDKLITRIYGKSGQFAINSGFYTISYLEDGKLKEIPARFSFVYEKVNNRWLIVDHHSSMLI